MKRRALLVIALFLVLSMLFSGFTTAPAVTKVSLDKTTLGIKVGLTARLTATVSPSSAKTALLTWSSSNKNIATVDKNGLVKAVKEGKATITVKSSNNKSAKCTVTVTAAKAVKIRFFITDPTDQQQIEKGLPEFNKLFPNIKVETVAVAGDNARAQINTAVLGGEQIDILYSAYNYFLGTAKKMYLPLNDLIKNDGTLDVQRDFGNYANYVTIDGKVYGLPKELAPAGILYNSAQFKAAGLPEPTPDWTWADFFDLANKLKVVKDGKVERYGAFDWDPVFGFVNAAMYSGWEICKADGKPAFDDPRFKEMIGLYRTAMIVNKSMPTPAETIANKYSFAVDMFKGKWSLCITGRNAAMFFDKHRNLWGTLPPALDDADTFKLAYMPKWKASSQPKLAYDIPILLALSNSTKYPEESFQLLKWVCTSLFELSARTTPQVPAYKKTNLAKIIEGWSYYQNNDGVYVKGKDRTALYNNVLDPAINTIVPVNTLKNTISAKYNDIATKYCSLILNNQMDLDTAIKKMQKEALDAYANE